VRASDRAHEAVAVRERALGRALRVRGERASAEVAALAGRMGREVTRAAARAPGDLEARRAALERGLERRMADARTRSEQSAALLAMLSPSRTVARGYAIVRDAASGAVVTETAAARRDQALDLELRDGRLPVRVEER
jgi:exodeoxyribonuclease VII large subunit